MFLLTKCQLMKTTLLKLISGVGLIFTCLISKDVKGQTYQRAETQNSSGDVNVPVLPDIVTVENQPQAVDAGLDGRGDLTTFATIKASPGTLAGLYSYSGYQDLMFPSVLPANETSYLRLETEDDLFPALLGGALGNALSGVLGTVLLGNQEITIQARNGSTVVLEKQSQIDNDFASESLRIVSNADNEYFAAITPSSSYDNIRVQNRIGSLIGLGSTKNLYAYGAFYNTSTNECDQLKYTSFSGSGGLVSVLDVNSGVLDAGNAIDNDPNSYSTLKLPVLGAAATIQQTVYFNGLSANTDTYYMSLSSPSDILSLDLLENIIIEAYNGTTLVDSQQMSSLIDLDLLGLFNSNERVNLAYTPNAEADRITVKVQNLLNLSLTSELRFYSILKNPPIPITNPSTQTTSISATLNASLNDTNNCMNSTYGFEYSTDPNFAEGTGTFIGSSNLNLGEYSESLDGLSPETTYYYRAISNVSLGGNNFSSYGEVNSFSTDMITWDGNVWDNIDGPTLNTNTRIIGDYDTAINGAISVKDLFISAGNSLIIDSGNPLIISGDVSAESQGSIDATQGSIIFSACEPQTINGFDFVDNTISSITANLCVDEELTVINQVKILDDFTIEQGDLNINNNGNLYFISDANKTARFGAIVDCNNTNITYTGNGSVTAERFIPAGSTSGNTAIRRAYRFLSSSIDTQGYGSINDNWQEGEQLISSYSANSQHPGYGVFITGFDNANTNPASDSKLDYNATGDSSMFMYNNLTNEWEFVTNTNDPLIAGKGYYILVRGDRTIDMSTNNPTPTDTRLRATGKLKICSQSYTSGTDLAALDEEFSFIGNPYQSAIDVTAVLDGGSNINPVYYWYLDPNIGVNGGYVTVDVSSGNGTSTPISNANKYLQAGQAMFIQNIANNPSLTIQESYKVDNDNLGVFKSNSIVSNNYELSINLIQLQSELMLDGAKLKFNVDYSNSVNYYDAKKFFNTSENLSLKNNGNNLSIERRNIPNHLETVPLELGNLNETSYQFELNWTTIPNIDAFLIDNYLDTEQLLVEGNNIYSFISNSVSNRFSIQFRNSQLNTSSLDGVSLSVYPNPTTNGDFTISMAGYNQANATVSIYNALGQRVYYKTHQVVNRKINIKSNVKAAGVYTLKLSNEDNEITKKIINR